MQKEFNFTLRLQIFLSDIYSHMMKLRVNREEFELLEDVDIDRNLKTVRIVPDMNDVDWIKQEFFIDYVLDARVIAEDYEIIFRGARLNEYTNEDIVLTYDSYEKLT